MTQRNRKPRAIQIASLSPIVPGQVLPYAIALKMIGWGEVAGRRAQREGLRVIRYGNSRFVFSDDLIKFLKEQGK